MGCEIHPLVRRISGKRRTRRENPAGSNKGKKRSLDQERMELLLVGRKEKERRRFAEMPGKRLRRIAGQPWSGTFHLMIWTKRGHQKREYKNNPKEEITKIKTAGEKGRVSFAGGPRGDWSVIMGR